MIKVVAALVFGLGLVSSPVMAAEGDVKETLVGVNDVYVPSGFDSRSEVFVVANGWFPNSCYKYSQAKVDHVSPTLHEVRTFASVTEGLCLTVIVPFHQEIQIGRLQPGEHSLRFVSGDGTYLEKKVVIE